MAKFLCFFLLVQLGSVFGAPKITTCQDEVQEMLLASVEFMRGDSRTVLMDNAELSVEIIFSEAESVSNVWAKTRFMRTRDNKKVYRATYGGKYFRMRQAINLELKNETMTENLSNVFVWVDVHSLQMDIAFDGEAVEVSHVKAKDWLIAHEIRTFNYSREIDAGLRMYLEEGGPFFNAFVQNYQTSMASLVQQKIDQRDCEEEEEATGCSICWVV